MGTIGLPMNKKKLKNPIKKHNGELNAFLNLIEKNLAKNSDSIKPITNEDLNEIADLVKGIEIDEN
jgi:hypothetical protein